MTLEKYLKCSAAELQAMTDEQLKAFFAPYLEFSRPNPKQPVLKTLDEMPNSVPRNYKKKAQEAKIARLDALLEKLDL